MTRFGVPTVKAGLAPVARRIGAQWRWFAIVGAMLGGPLVVGLYVRWMTWAFGTACGCRLMIEFFGPLLP